MRTELDLERLGQTVQDLYRFKQGEVMSAIVHIEPTAIPEGVSARILERVTEAAFGQRRKMLRQSLKGLPGALAALEHLGIDSQRRAETLSVEEFVAIGRELTG